ncbi:putative transcriptional regulator, GntR family [Candidatus Moduliflexus flocculans]|uniref:Putative transcriptional regulator, GntR family n=1 Tax=Candidatus Moduliflexus flocculans TaxID=1499966 RepID=A0A0S6VTZ3_9BACT|nr:putative transcriptional regulator, GntR family [Candidatus Moduliflexus flocculans]
MKFEQLLADRTRLMGVNVIREILKVVSQPGMISLAGGIPAPESFPMDKMRELTERVIDKYESNAFQYDLTEGFIPLREALVGYLGQKNIHASVDDILVASGSQGVLDALGKTLISPGDKIAVEAPTYLGALQAFNPYEPQYVRMDMDEDGLVPESLDEVLKTHTIKFIYTVPTFQNPTGRSVTLARRKQIAEIIQHHDALLIEDDPYSALRYRGEALPAIQTFAPEHVVYITTLSKILAPGLRLGICIAPQLIKKWLVIVKQGVDLHTNTFSQAIAAEYLAGGYLDEQLPKIINLYGPKLQAMLDAIEKYFPANFTWSKPEGGMFVWAEGPEGLDTEKLYWEAVKQNVAYVPGKFFYTQKGEGNATMRLNFTKSDEETIDRAIHILADVLKEACA